MSGKSVNKGVVTVIIHLIINYYNYYIRTFKYKLNKINQNIHI